MNPLENCGFYQDKIIYDIHTHTYCELLYVKKGRIKLYVETKEYLLEEGSMYIISPMERHAVSCLSKEYERYVCFLDLEDYEALCQIPALLSVLKNRPKQFNHVFAAVDSYIEELFMQLTKEFKYSYHMPYSSYHCTNLFTELLIYLYRNYPEQFIISQGTESLIKVQHYLDQNYMNSIKINELANHFYLSQYYLTHAFKKYTGYSPKQYITKLQFLNVRKLLLSSDLTISEIAQKTGFQTVNDLSRKFKKEYGTTPREYRILNKQKGPDYCPSLDSLT